VREIEIAKSTDEAEVVALWTACGLTIPANDPRADFRLAVEGASSNVLVFRLGGSIVASAMVGHDGHRGWIYYLAVARDHRARGLGRRMVEACEVWMTDRSVPKSQLMIRDTNVEVASFYARLGYAAVPRVTMQKVLRPRRGPDRS
jgi:Acetyltransferases